jgi:hypothetical protein
LMSKNLSFSAQLLLRIGKTLGLFSVFVTNGSKFLGLVLVSLQF